MLPDHRVDTPEAVAISFPIAGIGSRFLAAAIDLAIAVVLLLALIFGAMALSLLGQLGSEVAAILFLTLSFVILYGYYIIFETLWSGQTPGKKALKLRVIKRTGHPIGFVDALIRNLVRIVDFLPSFYGLGVVVMFISRESRRLGDYAADTIVVRDRMPRSLSEAVAPVRGPLVTQPAIGEIDPEELAWDLRALSPEDVSLMRRYLERAPGLRPEARENIAQTLVDRIAPRIGARHPLDATRFIDRVAYLRETAS